MTVCFFGNYLKDYGRVAVLRQAFIKNNINLIECHTRERGFKKYWSLFKQHAGIKKQYDLILVMMGGQTLVWFAKILSKKKIFFDAFASLYVTNVEDRRNCSSKGLKARYYAFLDWFSCWLADKVLLDTKAQIDFFIKKYGLPREKFIRVFVGADEKVYFPTNSQQPTVNKKFIIHWHGYIVPFYAVDIIIKAAAILNQNKDIEFRLVTRFNSKYKKIKQLVDELGLDNIKFHPECSHEELARYINDADVCLGVFGNNLKAQLVIPNKIFEAVACAKPVITADQKVIEELFTEGDNILLIKPRDSKALADKILDVKKNESTRKEVSLNCLKLFRQKLTAKVIISQLLSEFD